MQCYSELLPLTTRMTMQNDVTDRQRLNSVRLTLSPPRAAPSATVVNVIVSHLRLPPQENSTVRGSFKQWTKNSDREGPKWRQVPQNVDSYPTAGAAAAAAAAVTCVCGQRRPAVRCHCHPAANSPKGNDAAAIVCFCCWRSESLQWGVNEHNEGESDAPRPLLLPHRQRRRWQQQQENFLL